MRREVPAIAEGVIGPCPLLSRKRTLISGVRMSALNQQSNKSAVACCADHAPLCAQLDLVRWQTHLDLVTSTALVAGPLRLWIFILRIRRLSERDASV